MKERESFELTRKPVDPTLEVRGNIFMSEPGGGEFVSQTEEVIKEETTASKSVHKEKVDAARQAWTRLNEAELQRGGKITREERETQEMLIKMGMLPMAGGSGDGTDSEEPSEQSENTGQGERTLRFESVLNKEENQGYKEMFNTLDSDGKALAKTLAQSMYGQLADGNYEEAAILYGIQAAQSEKIKAQNEEILKRITEGGNTREGVAQKIKDTQKNLGDSERDIAKATNISEIESAFEKFVKLASLTEFVASEKYNTEYKGTLAKLEELKQQGNLNEIQTLVESFAKEIRPHYAFQEADIVDTPESLEDLAALIMRREGEEWKMGGDKPLLDENGKVIKENFMAWVRKKMIDLHEFSPTTTTDFFSGIIVKGRWSQISLQEMVLTGSYFLEKRTDNVITGVNPDGSASTDQRTTYHKNEDYEKLKHELLMEAFLFQTSRNAHVEYVANQSSEKDIAKLLLNLYSTNVFTRPKNLELIMSMPSMTREPEKMTEEERKSFKEGKEIGKKLEHNFEVGQAVRKLLMSYYYLYDYDTLQKILGPDAAIFQKEYRDMDSATGTDKIGENGSKAPSLESKGKKSGSEAYDMYKWYDDKGRVKLYKLDSNGKVVEVKYDSNGKPLDPLGKPPADFMEYINVFSGPGPNKDEAIVDEVRERMVQSIMKTSGLDYTEAKYAEAWAFSMTRWTGLAAKNDTRAVGHDAWTKVQNTQEYRFRQMTDQRNALYGNIFNVLGIKRVGVNWFEGIRDTNGRTIIEAIQGGQGSEMDLETPIKLRGDDKVERENLRISFNQDAMRLFAANHIVNSFALQEFLIDSSKFNFQDLLTFDRNGRSIIDYEKANKMIEGIQKAIRYSYSTWGGTDYSKEVRTWEIQKERFLEYGVEKEREIVVAKNLPILAELFGPEIILMLKKEAQKESAARKQKKEANIAKMTKEGREEYDKDEKEKRENTKPRKDEIWTLGKEVGEINVSEVQDIKDVLWKGVFKYLVQAEIESHRNVHSDQERFNMLTMEKIYSFLEKKRILTKEETKQIRKQTHSTVFGMMLGESGVSIWAGIKTAMLRSRQIGAQEFKGAGFFPE